MTNYIIRRILGLIPTLFIITVIVFLLMHLMPGNAFEGILANPKIKNAVQVYNNMLAQNGLNLPWWQQYVNWIVNMFHGNFGQSFALASPVASLIAVALPRTLLLAATAELIVLFIAIPIGVYQAKRANGFFDGFTSFVAVLFYSIPGFVFGVLLITYISFTLNWLPSSGTVTPMSPTSGDFVDRLRHLILPALALALPALAFYTRLTRGQVLQLIVQDFVRTAYAKGLSARIVLFRHVLRNAIIPLITQFGFDIGNLVGGAIIIEEIFTWPGMGELSIQAALQRDYPVILATTLLFAITVVIGNLIADVLLAIADPRIRY